MKSLSAILAGESLESLRALAALWGTEPPERNDADVRQRLERAMRDAIASRFVWETLGEAERRVLFAIVGPSARNWCQTTLLAERAHMEPQEAEESLERLTARGLVFTEVARLQGGDLVGQRATFYGYALPRNTQALIEEKPIAYVPTELATVLYASGREFFVPIAGRADKTLDELLMPYRQGDLDQIGRRFGLTLQAYYSRNEVRAAMADNLAQAEAVRYALSQVEPRVARLYEWLRERHGVAPLAEVRAYLRLDGVALAVVLRTLEDYALAFDTFSDGRRVLFIPRETLANVRKAEARPAAQVGLVEQTEPRAVQPGDTPFLWDLAAIVAAAHQQDIELTRSGALPKRAAQRLLPALIGPRARGDEETALAYVELLKQEAAELGLLIAPATTGKAKGRLGPGTKLDSWGRHDQVMQARRLFRRWPADRWWIDLPGANYQEWMTFYLELPVAREAVAKLLRDCTPGVWYSLASFRATLQGDNPYVLRPNQRFMGEAGFKLADDLRNQWERTDGELVAGMFASTLAELGIVALGYESESVPPAGERADPDLFMVTEQGAEVLHSELSASRQPSSKALVVQPNFEVLLMEPYMPALYQLVRIATLEQAGRVSRFTLTREALARGLGAASASADEVIAFLERHSQKPLPQNVVYTLRDWARQGHEAALAAAQPRTFEAQDERVAGEIATSPKLRAYKLRRIGPRTLAVPPETSLRDLWRALERLGYATLIRGLEEVAAAAGIKPRRTRSVRSSTAGTPLVKGA
ncbi:MAG TPA: helicase-associated domain-containing protein [Ktedonobacterales bacterium]